jgi:SAM-dependent methyltransferase
MTDTEQVRADVEEYYGKLLNRTGDLKTGACCCSTDSMPAGLRRLLQDIHPEVLSRFYGCGSPLPPALDGCTVLDLGCGTGRDVYLASRLVGPKGRVLGVDMTEAQLEIARRHADFHAQRFGYSRPNVSFHKGFIEDLASLGIADESIDVVISNCVINLSPRKDLVFSEIFRVLKPGGELYFSDIFADRRVPADLRSDPVLRGECLAGALYVEDFRRLLSSVGVRDFRTVVSRRVDLRDAEVEAKVGMIGFVSATIRAFKIGDLEDRCEDYGQVASYLGTVPGLPHAFVLDDHHRFEGGRLVPVCGNTAAMLQQTRYAPHCRVLGDRSTHYGLFPCAQSRAESDRGCC